ncbi:MAG: cytochrome ubiquinol oxidase subunit I [Chloroflexi bacterium HGW-Chloroflexi-10]|nr:MAG: cytochrome ubiquinol oxidase subunit I [Chloroflexi bacterium HGW-Chloroflexi-10]
MDVISLARWQFAVTTIFHFFFVPLTLGLSIFVAILETKYVRSGDENYKKMAKFWGKIFLINFAMGVVTGIVQEFQFGLNWSEYSRFMGDIFGAPLAIEALLAFYLESTFIGVWIFGWDKVSKKVHLMAAWLVAIGSNISALWILIANSFMQHPVGYAVQNGRAVMTDFFALLTNPGVWYQFPHVLSAGISLAGFVVMAFSAWHLLRNHDVTIHRPSFRYASVYALIGIVFVILVGHIQGQHVYRSQPAKMAASEALWTTEQPAGVAVIALIDEKNQTNTFELKIPAMLSFLATNSFSTEVKGVSNLQVEDVAAYGPGNYIPPVTLVFWSFRIMVGSGLLMLLLALLAVIWSGGKNLIDSKTGFLKVLLLAPLLPYLASTFGWIMAETGRWPWIVYGLQKIEDAVSPNVPAWNVALSLALFGVLYSVLTVIAFRLALSQGKGDIAIKASAASTAFE